MLVVQSVGRNADGALRECCSGTDPCLVTSHMEKCGTNIAGECIALIPVCLDRPDLTFKPSFYML